MIVGGQSSTGSIIRWARSLFGGDMPYKELDMEAKKINAGSDGLIALETFQGSRTPVTDPLARGALMGLTLSHTRAHIWRALMEAVCYGTRGCIEGLAAAGHDCDEIILAGGISRSPLWLQMHADVTGKPVVVCENTDAPLLGCAILASVGVGIHDSVSDAVSAMVRTSTRIEPDPQASIEYDDLYKNVYILVANAARPVAHAIDKISTSVKTAIELSGGSSFENDIVVSPSLLACDWARMRDEVHRCLESGATRLHVDIFDGVFLDSPRALTFGPQMVQAIRQSSGKATLDLHMCVDRPARYVNVMAECGGDCFIFQWEAVSSLEEAVALARHVVSTGMSCGVSLNPETSVDEILPLLETNLINVVDVLAVEPGFGGQNFQPHVLSKIEHLVRWRLESKLSFQIMIDGGVNMETAPDILDAGADVLVSGSFLFKHPHGIERGIQDLLQQSHR
jgi:ribulose-phosphate 3-epimerase